MRAQRATKSSVGRPAAVEQPSLVDRVTARLKNNPLAAAMMFVALAVGSVASFTDSVRKLVGVLPEAHPDLTGEWHSEVFTDPNYAPSTMPRQFYLQLRSEGAKVFGWVRPVVPPDRPLGIAFGIDSGRLDGHHLSLAYHGGIQHNDGAGRDTPVDELLSGVVSGDSIRFVYTTSSGTLPVEFTARRVTQRPPAHAP